MLDSRMPELAANEKTVGLHYKRSRKCFIDSVRLAPLLSPFRSQFARELRKLG
jgi:hypothetical protein